MVRNTLYFDTLCISETTVCFLKEFLQSNCSSMKFKKLRDIQNLKYLIFFGNLRIPNDPYGRFESFLGVSLIFEPPETEICVSTQNHDKTVKIVNGIQL